MEKYKLILIGLLFFCAGSSYAQKKSNIIIFLTDDQSQIDIGAYGNKDVHTPNMDKLAAEGMRFERAYAASPMCTPSRSNIFTGLHPFNSGAQLNHFGVRPDDIKTLPDYLKHLGYRVVISGKTHFRPESAFSFEYIGRYFGEYFPIENRNDPRKVTTNFIKEHFSTKPEQPLCLIVATWLPHVPWFPNKDYDPEKLDVPEYLIDTKETREALASYYQTISLADEMMGEVMQAVDQAGATKNTAFMFFSDQGTQLPGAKWTTYDQGLRVPFIVRWPGKIKKRSSTDALISLTDLTPTLIDIAGGDPVEGLDGKSFKDVLLGKKEKHNSYIFAETSVEPHYWYNYVPSRTIITDDGYHYIKNYRPGSRFITHIDAVERNRYYFSSWQEKAENNEKAAFLLNRYSYRPPEELYNLQEDRWELNNLVKEEKISVNLEVSERDDLQRLHELRDILAQELAEQGETEEMILKGQFPIFFGDNSYEIEQGISAHPMSFDKKKWNPDTLFVTGYIEGLDKEGILFKYFNQFKVLVKNNKLGVVFDYGDVFYSEALESSNGHLIMHINKHGDFKLKLNGKALIKGKAKTNHTIINGGYVSVGFARDEKPSAIPVYFKGQIHDLRFTMNKLNGAH